MSRLDRAKYERVFLTLARAVTVGAAYVFVSPIPGLTSSFVAIFTSLLPFDLIVASARPIVTSWQDVETIVEALKPRIVSTAITLVKGIAVGAGMGLLTILGLPAVVGAVLTSGLAYIWALNTRHNISTYVSILSGLALFERFATLDVVETVSILRESLNVIVVTGGGTFTGLIAGWVVGLCTGTVTRLFLSRPYRSVRSAAYDLPLEMRPFNEVLHVGEKSLVVSAEVEEGAPMAHRTLAESGLREEWHTSVLSVKRGEEEIVMPKGPFTLLPGDHLLLLTERDVSGELYEQFKARSQEEAVGESG